MDPITHALAGLGVASLSGLPLSLKNPIYISALIGSLAPDMDIVFQLKGDLAYLRHHRGASHSILGTGLMAAVLALPLAILFPEISYWQLVFWNWMGAMSHCILDILNSYGAMWLWPFYRKKISVNLLNIFDPYLCVLLLLMSLTGKAWIGIIGISLYLGFRYGLYLRVRRLIIKRYGRVGKRIIIMPTLKCNWTWDIFIETNRDFIVGQVHSFTLAFRLRQRLRKQQHKLIKTAREGKLGQLFLEFTPLFHVSHEKLKDGHLVQFFDLRYHFRQEFLHTGTAIFNQEKKLVEEIFSPYLGRRNTKIAS